MFIYDCVEGLLRLMASNYREPLNLGTEELVSVDQLVDMVCEVAGKKLANATTLSDRRACADATATTRDYAQVLGWEPQTPLRDGLEITYHWIEQELQKSGRYAPTTSSDQVEALQAV